MIPGPFFDEGCPKALTFVVMFGWLQPGPQGLTTYPYGPSSSIFLTSPNPESLPVLTLEMKYPQVQATDTDGLD